MSGPGRACVLSVVEIWAYSLPPFSLPSNQVDETPNAGSLVGELGWMDVERAIGVAVLPLGGDLQVVGIGMSGVCSSLPCRSFQFKSTL